MRDTMMQIGLYSCVVLFYLEFYCHNKVIDDVE